MSETLATFVHVSDLHISEPDQYGDGVPDPSQLGLASQFPIFEGVLGHRARPLIYLDEFFGQELKDEAPGLIVTGDLTCVGKSVEFQTAVAYLGGVYQPRASGSVGFGLDVGDWKERAVSGNHDRWPGSPIIFGFPTQDFYTHFRHLPFSGLPICYRLKDGTIIHLRFLGVDSDSDVHPLGLERALARGSCQRHVEALERRLNHPGPHEIRVLLIHHSLGYDDTKRRLRINRPSRDKLREFIRDYKVSVVLTGHIHVPRYYDLGTPAFPSMEIRCGTTSQRDTLPEHDWIRELELSQSDPVTPFDKKFRVNTVIVHRLVEEDEAVWWEAKAYKFGIDRTKAARFGFLEFPLPGANQWPGGVPRIPVWRRP
jgi:3',5'-cyclic AMP phosphodiesterase CpdA